MTAHKPTFKAMGARLLSVLGLIVVLASPPAARANTTTSSNWAGYAVHRKGVSFRKVQAAWIQPTVTCTPGIPTFSSFWVGLGGYSVSSPALEQIGTELDCTRSGRIRSGAWYELVPAGAVRIRLPVRPGDAILARVIVRARRVTLTLDDETARRSFTKTLTARTLDLSSAEWIVEAPSECVGRSSCQTLALADFGTTTFSFADAQSAGGHAGTITDPAWHSTKIELVPQSQHLIFDGGPSAPIARATPSPLQAGGSSFTVTYQELAPAGQPLRS